MKKSDYEKLVRTAHEAQEAYEKGFPTRYTDDEYDKIIRDIREVESIHPSWIAPESPTQVVGVSDKTDGFEKARHDVPMLSILDVFDEDSVRKFVRTVKSVHPDAVFSVEVKIDGLSMSVSYENGKLTRAETRGDGEVGDLVTENALSIGDIPEVIGIQDSFEVRGEVYMDKAGFLSHIKKMEETGKKKADNARNLAAGTLRLHDPEEVGRRGLRFFAFNVQRGPGYLMDMHGQGLSRIAEAGIPVVEHIRCSNAEEVIEAVRSIGKKRDGLPYGIDGAVVKIDQTAYRAEFQSGGSKYAPGHIAFKFPAESRVVEVTDITLDVGKTGKVSYVANVRDVETKGPAYLAGTHVSKVTANNMAFIRDMHIGIGGKYTLIKSGDIIPKLIGVVEEPAKVFESPDKCPRCGHPLVEKGQSDLFCLNPACGGQKIRTILNSGEKGRMNIIGLGSSIVESLVKAGYIDDFADLYSLKERRDDLIKDKVIGLEAGTDKLLKAIEASKSAPAHAVLAAINIDGVGRTASKKLIDHFGSIDAVLSASDDELLAVPDIGGTAVANIKAFLSDEGNLRMVEKLRAAGLHFEKEADAPRTEGGAFEGKTVVVTGTFTTWKRSELEAIVVSLGGKIGSGVSKKTDLLLCGEKAGSKKAKAEQLGVPIMTEEELVQLIAGSK